MIGLEEVMYTKAGLYAVEKHAGQKRKYTGEDYVTHCFEVAKMVESFTTDPHAIVAALLHDAVEDTDATFEEIAELFGETVALHVFYLTKVEAIGANRKERKALTRAKLSLAPDIIKAVKICDVLHNGRSIYLHDKKFWKTFKEETKLLLNTLNVDNIKTFVKGPEFEAITEELFELIEK